MHRSPPPDARPAPRHDASAGLLMGSDMPILGIQPGSSMHRNLQAFVHAGLTPYETLVIATRNVATYFGTEDSTGTVAVGKRADLVLLEGNPLKDIRHINATAG
jgi:imidazolonepropionase-like amidohydrolase